MCRASRACHPRHAVIPTRGHDRKELRADKRQSLLTHVLKFQGQPKWLTHAHTGPVCGQAQTQSVYSLTEAATGVFRGLTRCKLLCRRSGKPRAAAGPDQASEDQKR